MPRRRSAPLTAGSPWQSQPTVMLGGDRAATYLQLLLTLLDGSRINRAYPDRRAVAGLLRLLSGDGCHYLYNDLEVGLVTGLPTERMVTRIQADRTLASTVCRAEERRSPDLATRQLVPSSPGDDPYLRRYRYHRSLLSARVQPSFALHLELKRVDEGSRTASLVAVLDRFDLAEELFVRFTIHLAYRGERWWRDQVRVDQDRIEATAAFAQTLARTTGADSELTFLTLSETPGVAVESVERCRIGPLHAAGFAGEPALQAVVDAVPGELVLSLPADRCGLDIARDSNDDPVARGYREVIAGEALELVEARRAELGYRVRRQRKLVCTPRIEARLRAFLEQRGTPCVVHVGRPVAA